MNRQENLIETIKNNLESLKFSQIENILISFGFEIQKKTRGSHIKYRNKSSNISLILSPHNGDIKNYQKKQVRDILVNNNFI